MKQAILITAYKAFDQLYELVSFFDDDFEIFIHVDKKSGYTHAQFEVLRNMKSVKYVGQKYKVNWGGRNHLLSILDLCDEAAKNNENTFFHLITGQDYPIKPLAYFKDIGKSDLKKNYITNNQLPFKNWKDGGITRLTYYNFYDWINGKTHRNYIYKLVNFQKKFNLKRRISKKLPVLYGGDTYWSLRREALLYVLQYTRNSPRLLKRLKHSFCAEEIYFQTVLSNSNIAANLVSNNLRYIDWTGKNSNMPSILDESDFERLKESDALFARKLEMPISEALKEKIKSQLL